MAATSVVGLRDGRRGMVKMARKGFNEYRYRWLFWLTNHSQWPFGAKYMGFFDEKD
jgi:hypothetical protein